MHQKWKLGNVYVWSNQATAQTFDWPTTTAEQLIKKDKNQVTELNYPI